MADVVYELIKIEEFVSRSTATGNEQIPFGLNGTFKMRSSVLINTVAAQQGFIKRTALVPLNNQVESLNGNVASLNGSVSTLNSKTALLRLDVDSKIPIANIVDNLTTPSATGVASARQVYILNQRIEDFASQIGSGILGEAKPDTHPIVSGFGIYTVSTPGTYINFPDVDGNPLVVTQGDLDYGLVQLWGNDNVWEMNVTQVNSNDPESSETGFIQVPQ